MFARWINTSSPSYCVSLSQRCSVPGLYYGFVFGRWQEVRHGLGAGSFLSQSLKHVRVIRDICCATIEEMQARGSTGLTIQSVRLRTV